MSAANPNTGGGHSHIVSTGVDEVEAVAKIVHRELSASDPYDMESARGVAREILAEIERVRRQKSEKTSKA